MSDGPVMSAAIACFGAANIDQKARAVEPVQLGTSNPVAVRSAPGGVARNVAEGLARLGCRVSLASRVGLDGAGDRVVAGLAEHGIDGRFVTRSPDLPTAMYTALIDPGGDMVVAFADMAIYDEMTPDVVAPAADALSDHRIWFVDANLPAATIRYLLDHKPKGGMVAVDPVSGPKAAKLDGLIDRIDILFCNRDEIGKLAGRSIRAPLDICDAAFRLRAAGAGAIIVNLGSEGGFVATDRVYDFFAAPEARVRDVTGAGDSLAAGVLWALAEGRATEEAIRLGQASAALALESDWAVSPGLTTRTLLIRAGLAN